MKSSTPTRPARSAPKGTKGFSLIELLIVVAIILIIVAIAIPNLIRSRIAANEAAAVENVRTITTASVVYNTTWSNGYPPTLDTLGGLSSNPATCNLAILVDQTITSPPYQKSGFTMAYTGEDGTFTPTATGCSAPGFLGYLVTATPISTGVTGQRSFCSTEPAIIHFDITGSAITSETTCNALPPLQ
jgi:type IV pilus assembly protein PilA